MQTFKYSAYSSTGTRHTGTVRAHTQSQAYAQLSSRSLTPVALKLTRTQRWNSTLHSRHVSAFYLSLADLLRSGVPLEHALLVAKSTTANDFFRNIIHDIHAEVANGASFAEALSRHHTLFGRTSIRMIHASIEGGFLEQACEEIAALYQHNAAIRRDLFAASAYPAFLVLATIGIAIVLLTYFVPQFIPLFEDLASTGNLPWSTQCVLALSSLISEHPFVFISLAAASGLGMWTLFTRPSVQVALAQKASTLPLVGKLHIELGLTRLSSLLSALLKNGITLDIALRLCRGAVGHPLLEMVLLDAATSVEQGGRLSDCLRSATFIPRAFVATVSVAEASNHLDTALQRASEKYKESSSHTLSMVMRLSEPCLLMFMGLTIGVFVVALLQPLLNASATL
jgi:general secretion pathway protein F